jgi:DNA-binding transcriptional ArsR family regulator
MKEIDFRAAMLLESLGEPVRFQILRHLQDGPKAVVELARLTKRHQVTVCHHLAALRALHVVRYRNRGKFTFYELKLKQVTQILDAAVRCAQQALEMPQNDRG